MITQRQAHIVSELAAVVILAPILFRISTRPGLDKTDRLLLRAIAYITVIVDGALLYKNPKK